MTNPYDVLGVPPTATDADITREYRALVKRYHPDRNVGDEDAKARYAAVDAAYAVLSDPDRRARFDATGQTDEAPRQHPHADVMSVLAPVLAKALEQLVKEGARPDAANVVAYMKRVLKLGQAEAKKGRDRLEQSRAVFAATVERFRDPEGEEPLLKAVARRHVAQIDEQVRQVVAEEARLAKAAEYLARCSYQFTAKDLGIWNVSTFSPAMGFWGDGY